MVVGCRRRPGCVEVCSKPHFQDFGANSGTPIPRICFFKVHRMDQAGLSCLIFSHVNKKSLNQAL